MSASGPISNKGDLVNVEIGIGTCDEDPPRGLVRETPELVIVGGLVTTARRTGAPTVASGAKPVLACAAMRISRHVDVRMKDPVGTRVIVDAVSAEPLLTPSASLAP